MVRVLIILPLVFVLLISVLASGRQSGQAAKLQWLPVPVQTWREIQRGGVEMQDLDYSCGAAALATLLREFYGVETNEAGVLQRMETNEAASFADLAAAADTYGFRATGLRISLTDLLRLRIPAIVHLSHRGEAHFSVVRGVRADGLVSLADPSWGNRQLLRHQFAELWDTGGGAGEGYVLLIIPLQKGHPMRSDFFHTPQGAASAYQALRFMRQSANR